MSFGAGTTFEQYKNIFTNLSLIASYDDLRTNSSASESLKKQKGQFSELAGSYGFTFDKRDRAFMPTNGAITSFKQSFPFFADKRSISTAFKRMNRGKKTNKVMVKQFIDQIA